MNTLIQTVKEQWNKISLAEEKDISGTKISKGDLLLFLIQYQIQHLGKMTILMHQANLKMPAIYGPAIEEWANFGTKAPKYNFNYDFDLNNEL
ncbi:hypothetical protein CO726_23275 [Bacillus fungorum]|uniref:DinB-like domain-containing protein n=1 Tax=Bacillus fungorum TaxID=2039284 RepID=A0A2G6Q871_9BACI|nr:hypothetical protein CO726_23275 [Bacillus fungorum]